MNAPRFLFALALVGCTTPPPPRETSAPPRTPAGLYWGRWGDVPDGVRVQVWLHGVGDRFRGTWELPPWHGELSGARTPEGHWDVEWREEGVVAVLATRTKRLRLRADGRTGALRGDVSGERVELTPAGMPDPRLRPGLWLGRWTGLPHGMAVETALSRGPDGRWRAAYRYQEREGSFDGDVVEALSPGRNPSLAIHWREVSSRGGIAQGAGLLRPSATGLQGTYGVGEEASGTGFWSLEPVE